MNTTLLHKILDQMQEKKWNMTKLSEKSGLFKSEVSRLLNQKQSLSFNNLESITKFGLRYRQKTKQ